MSLKHYDTDCDGCDCKVICDEFGDSDKVRVREAIEKAFEDVLEFENWKRERKGEAPSHELPPHRIVETEYGFKFFCDGMSPEEWDDIQDALDEIARPYIHFSEFKCCIGKDEHGSLCLIVDYTGTMIENIISRIHDVIWRNKLYPSLVCSESNLRMYSVRTKTHCKEIPYKLGEKTLRYVVTFMDVREESLTSLKPKELAECCIPEESAAYIATKLRDEILALRPQLKYEDN